MAWISVEQTILGKKLRVLAKSIGCSQNEAIGILINLWLWGLDNARDDGLIEGATTEDIAYAITPCLATELDADAVVRLLVQNGWIDEADGDFFIHDWEEYRFYYNRYITQKKKHSERQRDYMLRKRNAEKAAGEVEPKKPETEKKKTGYSKDFEELWSIYPRKVDKGNAYKKYCARLKDGFSEQELLTAVRNYAEECKRNRTEDKYIKHAKTFFSESTPFTDYLGKKESEPGTRKASSNENPFL